MRSSDSAGRSIRSDVLYPALSGEWEVPVTRDAEITGGWGAPPLRDHLWQGPPLPVTLRLTQRLMTPPPKMTKGGVMTPVPPSSPFNSILDERSHSIAANTH